MTICKDWRKVNCFCRVVNWRIFFSPRRTFYLQGVSVRILLSNDDGIYAPGLRAMYKTLSDAGHHVIVVAPASEQSAAYA